MRILCLCATYGRPKLLANAVACFERQNYPADKRFLLICDDAGQYGTIDVPNFAIISTPMRFPSMPAKYNAMLASANVRDWDAVAIWDDDDIYLPDHLANHAEQLAAHGWSYPKQLYAAMDTFRVENANGNHWAMCAFRRDFIERNNGWEEVPFAAWDHHFLRQMESHGPPGRSDKISFVFRWGSTGHPHLQNFITGPMATDAYQRMPLADGRFIENFQPELDAETAAILERYVNNPLLVPQSA